MFLRHFIYCFLENSSHISCYVSKSMLQSLNLLEQFWAYNNYEDWIVPIAFALVYEREMYIKFIDQGTIYFDVGKLILLFQFIYSPSKIPFFSSLSSSWKMLNILLLIARYSCCRDGWHYSWLGSQGSQGGTCLQDLSLGFSLMFIPLLQMKSGKFT